MTVLESEIQGKPSSDVNDSLSDDDRLFCAACGHAVTRTTHAVARRGTHEHTVFNPMGRLFTIRCFSEAAGATVWGDPTPEFTWFPGFAWQYALCRGCAEHIGWVYTNTDDAFFGLIKQALSSRPEPR